MWAWAWAGAWAWAWARAWAWAAVGVGGRGKLTGKSAELGAHGCLLGFVANTQPFHVTLEPKYAVHALDRRVKGLLVAHVAPPRAQCELVAQLVTVVVVVVVVVVVLVVVVVVVAGTTAAAVVCHGWF